METVKRVYAKPTILKVQLSHEQAVLASCSTSFANLVQASAKNQCVTGACRKGIRGGHDSIATS